MRNNAAYLPENPIVYIIFPESIHNRASFVIFVTEDGLEEKIKALLTEKTGFNPRAFVVKQIDVIPVKTSGKIDYPELQKML